MTRDPWGFDAAESTRIAILGNSGAGKSTLAKYLAARSRAAVLDLDTIYWDPDEVTVERPPADRLRDLNRFLDVHATWIIEGCYADLIEASLTRRPELIFMNPGLEVCLRHGRRRPFEPHKYPSKKEQDRLLEPLMRWIADYYERDGPMSLRGHRALFTRYPGPKREITAPPAASGGAAAPPSP